MKIRIVDAFTDRPFAGNPAGVVILDSGAFPGADRLQLVAAEVNLSETAFVHPLPPGGEADWALRWFTPTTEVDLCGHATLAAAHVLHTTEVAGGTVRYATRSGVLRTTAHADGTLTLDFPTAPLKPVSAPPGLTAALGVAPLSVHDTGEQVGDLLVELADERAVRTLRPDFAALASCSRRGVIATAAAEDPADAYDFVSRGFFPAVGIDEDPVTGSAHTALAPFWSARFGRDDLVGVQASARSGLVRTSLRGERTLLTGSAVTVIDGELLAGL
ncbi:MULTISPECIES: PhzF family phenazine biosynthesis protein [Streptomyces]|uniref:PhzF family phenazine biosynthesis protein n=1 Tax=Streptomyces mutomycini TaxID=284036 RepID=A0ABW0B9J4_9ACTN|nr:MULTISPECIES: PhzF family phenazine biosynthesis protein [Streptomyces]KPC78226.1 oxidoreductase [Streptomyces sp. NRRL S-4]